MNDSSADPLAALPGAVVNLVAAGRSLGGVLVRDLAQFEREAGSFAGEAAGIPDGEEERREFRHDIRNRLNHLFGLAQLMRLEGPPPDFLAALEQVVSLLESCLAALSAPAEETPETPAGDGAPAPEGGGKLLIADDDAGNREILRRLLEPRGFELAFAVNGVETLARMEREDFDAVLLDIGMPEMDGFEVLERLRESGRLGHTPVIVVTGLQEEQDAVRCIEIGAEDFLSRPIRAALLMARLRASLEKKRLREKVFEQHFTPELARELARNPDPMKMQARQAEVSVLFCDIRGFSAISERLGPTQTIAWLGGVMGEFSSVVIDHGGVLVDYTGDELLAMWGAPNEQPDHAELACRTALEILRRLRRLDEEWRPVVGAETEVGIGINSGPALVGNVGTHRKFKYGPLGTAVNLASRVQGATKFLETDMLVTGETARRAGLLFPMRRLCRVRVKNIQAPVDLHEPAPPGAGEEWMARARLYEEALAAFEQGDFTESETLLDEVLEGHPGDGPARLLRARIAAERTGMGVAFDPVWSLPGK